MSDIQSSLLTSLETYVRCFEDDKLDSTARAAVVDAMNGESRPEVYRIIADNFWGRFFVVEVDLAILILRKWLSIDPTNNEAKKALGTYLFAHGPDWDQEAYALLAEPQDNR